MEKVRGGGFYSLFQEFRGRSDKFIVAVISSARQSFLADRTNGRAYATLLRLSVCRRLYVCDVMSRSSARVRGWRRKLVRFGLGPPQLFLPRLARISGGPRNGRRQHGRMSIPQFISTVTKNGLADCGLEGKSG